MRPSMTSWIICWGVCTALEMYFISTWSYCVVFMHSVWYPPLNQHISDFEFQTANKGFSSNSNIYMDYKKIKCVSCWVPPASCLDYELKAARKRSYRDEWYMFLLSSSSSFNCDYGCQATFIKADCDVCTVLLCASSFWHATPKNVSVYS
jgi:hypothetical protein